MSGIVPQAVPPWGNAPRRLRSCKHPPIDRSCDCWQSWLRSRVPLDPPSGCSHGQRQNVSVDREPRARGSTVGVQRSSSTLSSATADAAARNGRSPRLSAWPGAANAEPC
jgi:hypothetical protein